jgi:hypothetical protein
MGSFHIFHSSALLLLPLARARASFEYFMCINTSKRRRALKGIERIESSRNLCQFERGELLENIHAYKIPIVSEAKYSARSLIKGFMQITRGCIVNPHL